MSYQRFGVMFIALLVLHSTSFRFRNYWSYRNPAKPEDDRKYVVEVKPSPLTEGSALSEEDRRIN